MRETLHIVQSPEASVDTSTLYGEYLAENPEIADDFIRWEYELSHEDGEEDDFARWEAALLPEASADDIELLVQPEPQRSFPQEYHNSEITEHIYSLYLSWRIGNVGHALDVVREQITNEQDAEKWLEYKAAVQQLHGTIHSDPVIALEKAVGDFCMRLNIDMAAFDRAANK